MLEKRLKQMDALKRALDSLEFEDVPIGLLRKYEAVFTECWILGWRPEDWQPYQKRLSISPK